MSICRMGESGLVIQLALCSIITEDGEQGFSKTGPIFKHIWSHIVQVLFVNCRH